MGADDQGVTVHINGVTYVPKPWYTQAQNESRLFREARERAQVVCRLAIATYGDLAAVHAAAILRELALLDGPPEAAPNLQPEAAGNVAAVAECVVGNEMGECVLEDGHETVEPFPVGADPEILHVDRTGYRWAVAEGD